MTVFAARADVFSPAQLDQIRAIVREELAARRPRANSKRLSQLLAGIVILWGYEYPFLAEHLHDSTDPNLRFLLQGRSVKAIGKLLGSGDGHIFDGRQLVAEDPIDGRRQWSVRQV